MADKKRFTSSRKLDHLSIELQLFASGEECDAYEKILQEHFAVPSARGARGMIWNKESLQVPKEQRAQMRGLRNPAIWWFVIMAVVAALYVRYH